MVGQAQPAGPLRVDNRQANRLCFANRLSPLQLRFDSAQNQLLHGAASLCRLGFQAPVNWIRNVHCGSHRKILPYLWFGWIATRYPDLPWAPWAEPDRRAYLRLVSPKQAETPELIEPGLEKPKPLNIEVCRGNVQGPASVSGQKLVQDIRQAVALIVDYIGDSHVLPSLTFGLGDGKEIGVLLKLFNDPIYKGATILR